MIEYSGYGYANPTGPENGIAVLANLMGFAVVDVNMRGTGCSGGAYDFFEHMQNLDGYDVIETIAHQPWVLGNKVGMFGISYGGISQLFTAQLRPPDLEAIAPLSVIDATATTLYPGGILNTGFAVAWAKERQQNAEPAGPANGQALGLRTDPGRRHDLCGQPGPPRRGDQPDGKDQSERHLQPGRGRSAGPRHVRPQDQRADVHGLPVGGRADGRPLRRPGPALHRHRTESGSRSPTALTSTRSIRGPTTGCMTSWSCTSPIRHQSSTRPSSCRRPGHLRRSDGSAENGGGDASGGPDPAAADLRIGARGIRSAPSIRVLFDNGAGTSPLGSDDRRRSLRGFEETFSSFPIPGTKAQYLVSRAGGTLNQQPAEPPKASTATPPTPNATPLTDFGPNTGAAACGATPRSGNGTGRSRRAGSAVSYVSAPLASQHDGDRWRCRSPLGEVLDPRRRPAGDRQRGAPDGNETFVQNGWIRASERKLATNSKNIFKQKPTVLQPIPTMLASDVRTDAGRPVRPCRRSRSTSRATPTGPARASGSRSRPQRHAADLVVQPDAARRHDGDGVDRLLAEHALEPDAADRAGGRHADGAAACPSLRNEPCRPYVAYVNNGS